jgi:pleiotropic regulator 1
MANEGDTVVSTEQTLAAKTSFISRKRSRLLFSGNKNGNVNGNASTASQIIPPVDREIHKASVARRVRLLYPVIPSTATTNTEDNDDALQKKKSGNSLTSSVLAELKEDTLRQIRDGAMSSIDGTSDNASVSRNSSAGQVQGQIVIHRESDLSRLSSNQKAATGANNAAASGVLALPGQTVAQDKVGGTDGAAGTNAGAGSNGILVKKSTRFTNVSVPRPKWHAPWQLSTVISSHLGWVRSIAFDPTNDMFATGSADRTVKIFDFAKACVGANDALKLTLTGHISPVRGLAFSPRHPYLFTAGEDKMVKCWDLETNQVVRHYHGHLSGVFDLKLHPTLDLLVTGGRDAVARVWDMRTKNQVFCLTGHDNTVGAILTKSTDPQIITGSYDSTVKLWDLTGGKCMSTLTHHKKSVRALTQPTFENSFISGAADTLKKWQGKEGRFIKNFSGHKAIINTLAMNDDGVVVSGADNGTMNFWDYQTGYCFQKTETVAQPGSLDAENGIFAAEFDLTGTRLITGEADKSIKIWKQNDEASDLSHPVDMHGWRKKCLAEAKQRK